MWNALVKRTKPYLLPGVIAMTLGSDVRAADLLARTTTGYLVWPEHELEKLAGPLNLVLTALMSALARETDRRPAHTYRPVIIAVDEAGRVKVPDLPDLSSTLAGRNVSLALYVQALDQLWDSYGLSGGETILANCHHKVFHPALSLKTAQYISDNLGRVSVPEEKRSRAPGLFGPETITQGYAARPLLTPDEVRMLGPDEIIVLSRNALPIRGKRLGFPDLKVLKERARLGPTPLRRLELPTPKSQLSPPAGEVGQAFGQKTGKAAIQKEGAHEKDASKKAGSKREQPGPKGYIDPEEA